MDKKDVIREIIEWILCAIVALIIAFCIKYYVGIITVVKQTSMYTTLHPNDRLLVNRISRTMKKLPQRGEIITFEAPKEISEKREDNIATFKQKSDNIFQNFLYYVIETDKKSYIKRVIGLPGEHVEIKNGKVYINGEELKEDYLGSDVKTESLGGQYTDFVVPENCVFAMGDNRPNSKDCRAFGCIPLEKIEGTVITRIWPMNSIGKVK